jgi:hypothetical protein
MTIALTIGWFMSRVILILLFFLILTPPAIFSRLFGKKYIDTNFRQNWQPSYWVPLNPQYKKETFHKMYHQ